MLRMPLWTFALIAFGIVCILATLSWFSGRALLRMTWTLNRALLAGWIACLVAMVVYFFVLGVRMNAAIGVGVLKYYAARITIVFLILFGAVNIAQRLHLYP
jgi:hypothetical protein